MTYMTLIQNFIKNAGCSLRSSEKTFDDDACLLIMLNQSVIHFRIVNCDHITGTCSCFMLAARVHVDLLPLKLNGEKNFSL